MLQVPTVPGLPSVRITTIAGAPRALPEQLEQRTLSLAFFIAHPVHVPSPAAYTLCPIEVVTAEFVVRQFSLNSTTGSTPNDIIAICASDAPVPTEKRATMSCMKSMLEA